MSLIDRAPPATPDSLRNWRLWTECWARGEFRTVDAPNTALLIVALLDGLGLQAVIGDSTVTVSKARAILNDYVGSLRL